MYIDIDIDIDIYIYIDKVLLARRAYSQLD